MTSHFGQHVELSDVSLGARPRYSLAVDKDVKKPNKETNKSHFEAIAIAAVVAVIFLSVPDAVSCMCTRFL